MLHFLTLQSGNLNGFILRPLPLYGESFMAVALPVVMNVLMWYNGRQEKWKRYSTRGVESDATAKPLNVTSACCDL